jgi:hypothetical protein
MTLEEAVTAFMLAYPGQSRKADWLPGETELADELAKAAGITAFDLYLQVLIREEQEVDHDP